MANTPNPPQRRSHVTREQAQAWRSWYDTNPGNYEHVAAHFGVTVSQVRGAFARYGLQRPQRQSDMLVDPFGWAAAEIRSVVQRAMEHDGAMGEREYEILQAIQQAVS